MFQMFPNQENVHDKMMKLLNVQLSFIFNLEMKSKNIDQLEPKVAVVPHVAVKEELIEIFDAIDTATTAVSPVKDNLEVQQLPLKPEIEKETSLRSTADETLAIDYETVKKGANRKSDADKKESKKTPFNCDLCEFKTFTRFSIKKHQLSHKIITFECNNCSKSFDDKEKLSMHMKEHSKEMPYSCSRCKCGFFQKEDKNQHEKSCKPSGQYYCKQCNFSCNSKIGLMSHEKIHAQIVCDHCNKHFSSNWNLQQHKRCISRRSAV